MNERIQELARQADPGYTGNADDVMGNALVGNEAIEKFAQLIVRECAGIYDKIENGNRHLGIDDYLEALQRTFFGIDG